MYLPADLREHLKSLALEPPSDNSPELTEWLGEVKRANPDVYALITRRAVHSVPETELEKAQRRARAVGAARQTARRYLTKLSAVGDGVPNFRLGMIIGLGAIVAVVMGAGLISGVLGGRSAGSQQAGTADVRPAAPPDACGTTPAPVGPTPGPAGTPVVSLPADSETRSSPSGIRQALAGELSGQPAQVLSTVAAVPPPPPLQPPRSSGCAGRAAPAGRGVRGESAGGRASGGPVRGRMAAG